MSSPSSRNNKAPSVRALEAFETMNNYEVIHMINNTDIPEKDNLHAQRNPLLFFSERRDELSTCKGYYPESSEALILPSEALCGMAASHAEVLNGDIHSGLRAVSIMMETYSQNKLTTYEDDMSRVMYGMSRLIATLLDAGEVAEELSKKADDAVFAHKWVKETEMAIAKACKAEVTA